MTPQDVENIGIWGFGREGRAGLAFLQKRHPGARFTVIDSGPRDVPEGGGFVLEDSALGDIAAGAFDLILKSPGISLYHPEIVQAQANGTHVTSGTNLWFEENPDVCVIAVTGTKGKSTTAALLHHMLTKCGVRSALAGNIGTPLLETPEADVTVVEMSSYQTADLQYPPEIAVLTNVMEAHVEWHGSRARYHADKMRLFTLSDDTTAIIGASDETAKELLGERENVLFYGANTGDLVIPEFLSRAHNIRNIAAAMTAVEALNALSRLPQNALEDFQPLPHRQEIIGERGGIAFVDDSISTVPETAAIALESFADRAVALILGGEEKRQDFAPVRAALQKHGNVKVFCIPDSGARLASEFEGAVLCADLEEAVEKAAASLPEGGYVILSPGTPSFPVYENYVERSAHFRACAGF